MLSDSLLFQSGWCGWCLSFSITWCIQRSRTHNSLPRFITWTGRASRMEWCSVRCRWVCSKSWLHKSWNSTYDFDLYCPSIRSVVIIFDSRVSDYKMTLLSHAGVLNSEWLSCMQISVSYILDIPHMQIFWSRTVHTVFLDFIFKISDFSSCADILMDPDCISYADSLTASGYDSCFDVHVS